MEKQFLLGCGIFVLDILTKALIFGKTIIITPFLIFIPVKNTGAAFSFFQNSNLHLIFITIAIIGYLLYQNEKFDKYALAFILAGAVGNLLDRIFFGFVRDFISIGSFPVFNIADAAITVGAILLILREFFPRHNKTKNTKKRIYKKD